MANEITFDYVKHIGLPQARPYVKRKITDRVVVHHFGGDFDVAAVARNHISEGHAGIDYNFIVLKDGTVVEGRGLEYAGGHTLNKPGLKSYGLNDRSVGVAFQGDFSKEHISQAQFEAGKRLIADIVRYYNFKSADQVIPHRAVKDTDCPGNFFPMDELIDFIRAGGTTPVKLTETFRVSKVLRKGINDAEVIPIVDFLRTQGYTKRDTSIFDKDIESCVKAYQRAHGLEDDGEVGKLTTRAMGGEWVGK